MPPLPPSPDERDRMDIDGGPFSGGQGAWGPSGGGGLTGGFIPTYGQGGQAMPWSGLPQGGPYSPFRRLRGGVSPFGQQQQGGGMGAFGGGGQMVQSGNRTAMPMIGGAASGNPMLDKFAGRLGWAQPGQQGGGNEFSIGGVFGGLLENAFGRQDPNYGGMFSFNPPEAIMQGVRQRAISDAGAQERAARLGLQSRGGMDPSTYGFQALMSQLQGQQGVNQALGQADLGLRQQQLEQYWNMLNALLGQQGANERAHIGSRAGGQDSGLGGFLGGLGGMLPGIGGLFRGGGGGGGGAPTMGSPGYQWPRA